MPDTVTPVKTVPEQQGNDADVEMKEPPVKDEEGDVEMKQTDCITVVTTTEQA